MRAMADPIAASHTTGTHDNMSLEPLLRFPVVCPRCMRETLFHIPQKLIAEALLRRNDISLSAPCCGGVDWVASGIETEQIRQYLSLVGVMAAQE